MRPYVQPSLMTIISLIQFVLLLSTIRHSSSYSSHFRYPTRYRLSYIHASPSPSSSPTSSPSSSTLPPMSTTASSPSSTTATNMNPANFLPIGPEDQSARSMIGGQVQVCSNRWCRERGSDATMATFTFLSPPNVSIVGSNCQGKCAKGPNVRIVVPGATNSAAAVPVEASNVRSVDAVVSLLQSELKLNVNMTSAAVLRLNYEGNVHLRNGEVDLAVDCYDRALELGDKEQEGVLLVMRGTALLQRAYACKIRYKDIGNIAEGVLPSLEGLRQLLSCFATMTPAMQCHATLESLLRVSAIFKKLDKSPYWTEYKLKWPEATEGKMTMSGDELLGRMTFTWALYESALMKSLQDLLTSTIVLPGFAQGWRRAGDVLGELRLYNQAISYYEVAIRYVVLI